MIQDFSRLKVLVADDEPQLRALVTACVNRFECRVIEAGDGDEAWQLAQAEVPDVVILDVMMPGMSGWEVCRRIKSHLRTMRGCAPKVLMLTGIGAHLNEMTSPLFAADDWVNKPFQLDELTVRIARLALASLSEGAAPPLASLSEGAAPPSSRSGPSIKKAKPRKPKPKTAPAKPKKKAPAKPKKTAPAKPKKKATAKPKKTAPAKPKKKATAKPKKASKKKPAAKPKKASKKKPAAKPKKKATAKPKKASKKKPAAKRRKR
jgi:CheY-like chemotaxis protein